MVARISFLLLALMAAFGAMACGGGEQAPAPEGTPQEEERPPAVV